MYLTVRAITAGDWPAIEHIQRNAYPEPLHESLTSLQSKVAASPSTCWVVQDQDERILGYLLSHRWHDALQPPALNSVPSEVEVTGNGVYLHDLAIDPVAQKQGVSAQLWRQFVRALGEQGLSTVYLVAANNSADYWAYKGFETAQALDANAGYGDGAQWMITRWAGEL